MVERSKLVGKADFLLTFLPIIIVQAILCLAAMSGVAIRQASSKVTRRIEEDINQRPKRLCEKENTAPAIPVDVSSTATLTEENLGVNDLFLTENQKERSTAYLAMKLNSLKDKQARFVSHKEFLTCCLAEELVLEELKATLEPTIGNHDQEFLDNWYSKQKQFSLLVMEDILQFCEKTINKTVPDIKKLKVL